MKRSILLIVMAILLSTPLFSQCPDGYSEWNGTLTVGNCPYNVKVCYKCEVSVYGGEIMIFGFSKANPSCPDQDPNTVLANLSNQIASWQFINSQLCSTAISTCYEPPYGIEVLIHYEICWQKFNENGTIWYLPCWNGEVLCDEIWKYCWDPNTQSYLLTLVQRSSPPIEAIYCTNPENTVQNPPVNQYSSCFFLISPCYP